MIDISPDLLRRIHQESVAAYPDEGCGALLGTFPAAVGPREVADILPIDNARESEEQYHRFRIDPLDYRRADDAAAALGLDIVGFYHSHPDHPAIPSDYDRDHAFPGLSYIVVAVEGANRDHRRVARSTSWELAPDRSRMLHEAEFEIEPD